MTLATSPSLQAVFWYAVWTLSLLFAIALQRASLVLRGLRAANSFSPLGNDVSPFSERLCRAHANCLENLPVVAVVVFVAHWAGRAEVTDPLAWWLLGARLAQSLVHLSSVSVRAVSIRFAFMLVQMAVLTLWVAQLAPGLLPAVGGTPASVNAHPADPKAQAPG